jgi:putative tryptophan/tyrosine transport system substrate-binding protein
MRRMPPTDLRPQELPTVHRRIGFFLLLVFVILVAPLATAAPPPVVRIGRLSASSPPPDPAFQQTLRTLGYVEGDTLRLEERDAEGHEDRLPALAADLVRLPVDLLMAAGVSAVRAAQQATHTIPIIMACADDPVEHGFVASLAQPAGNITGLSCLSAEFTGKRLELLVQAVSTVSRIAVLGTPTMLGAAGVRPVLQGAAEVLGVQLQILEVNHPAALERAFATMLGEGIGALLSLGSPVFSGARTRLVALAAQHRLPAMFRNRADVEAGGLMAYGPNFSDIWRRAAVYTDKRLKGAKPAKLPVEQPTTFELVINFKTAEALGLTIPPALLFQATAVLR